MEKLFTISSPGFVRYSRELELTSPTIDKLHYAWHWSQLSPEEKEKYERLERFEQSQKPEAQRYRIDLKYDSRRR